MKNTLKIDPEKIDSENPEWMEDDFKQAKPAYEFEALQGILAARRGRPKLENPKEAISIRLSAEILDYFKSTGKGWQSRVNDVLKNYVEEQKHS